MSIISPDLTYTVVCCKCNCEVEYEPILDDYATLEEARDSIEEQMVRDGWVFVEDDPYCNTHICPKCYTKILRRERESEMGMLKPIFDSKGKQGELRALKKFLEVASESSDRYTYEFNQVRNKDGARMGYIVHLYDFVDDEYMCIDTALLRSLFREEPHDLDQFMESPRPKNEYFEIWDTTALHLKEMGDAIFDVMEVSE